MNVSKIIALAITASLLGACAMKPEGLALTGGGTQGGGGTGGGNISPTPEPRAIWSSVNVIHANNIVPMLSTITGVTPNTNTTAAETQYRAALSPSGDPMGFTPQMSLASLALVTSFCREAATREAGLADTARIMYPGIVLNAAMPAGGFPDATLQKIVQNSWERFRGESQVPSDVMSMMVTSLKNIYAQLPATTNVNTSASKANVVGAKAIAESGCMMVGAAWASLSNPK